MKVLSLTIKKLNLLPPPPPTPPQKKKKKKKVPEHPELSRVLPHCGRRGLSHRHVLDTAAHGTTMPLGARPLFPFPKLR